MKTRDQAAETGRAGPGGPGLDRVSVAGTGLNLDTSHWPRLSSYVEHTVT